jgi:hypothetical protein
MAETTIAAGRIAVTTKVSMNVTTIGATTTATTGATTIVLRPPPMGTATNIVKHRAIMSNPRCTCRCRPCRHRRTKFCATCYADIADLKSRTATSDQPEGRRTPRSGGPEQREGWGNAPHFLRGKPKP